MKKKDGFHKLKAQMRARLTADPRTLCLDARTDEAPEDMFASPAHGDRRGDVSQALRELIAEFFTNATKSYVTIAVRFLTRALRLCSDIEAEACKPVLKLILLDTEGGIWGKHLDEMHELAARALLGLRKTKGDFRFWADVANMQQRSLPYALSAAIEINLHQGLCLFWELYRQSDPRKEHPYVDWRTIIDEADEHHNEDEIRRCLEETYYEVVGERSPHDYERVLRHFLKIPRYSRVRVRGLEELSDAYGPNMGRSLAVPPATRRIEPPPSKPRYELPQQAAASPKVQGTPAAAAYFGGVMSDQAPNTLYSQVSTSQKYVN